MPYLWLWVFLTWLARVLLPGPVSYTCLHNASSPGLTKLVLWTETLYFRSQVHDQPTQKAAYFDVLFHGNIPSGMLGMKLEYTQVIIGIGTWCLGSIHHNNFWDMFRIPIRSLTDLYKRQLILTFGSTRNISVECCGSTSSRYSLKYLMEI